MKAIIIEQYGGPEKLVTHNLPDPESKPGQVVIKVKAFGINHAETHGPKSLQENRHVRALDGTMALDCAVKARPLLFLKVLELSLVAPEHLIFTQV